MSETITRDLAVLAQALRDEADQCDQFGITKPAALLREAAAVIQMDANMDAMDEFAEVNSVGHLSELVATIRNWLNHQADEWDDHEELNGPLAAATLRQIAGDYKPHPKLPLLPSEELQADRVRRIEENGPYPGMSVAFERHMGDDQAWTDPAYAPDASMWAAAWKAATRHAADGFRAQAARDTADLKMQFRSQSREQLSLDQIAALEAGCGHASLDWDTRVSVVRATEAAHGIGA